jgi:hypothetical protein
MMTPKEKSLLAVRAKREKVPEDGATVLVGERANGPWAVEDHEEPLARIQHGAFRWGVARDRLLRLGLRWDAAMNLLTRAPRERAAWDAEARERAHRVAGRTHALAMAHGWRLVLAGARVCHCFGVTYEPLAVGPMDGVEYLVIPHPSGMCRWWNEGANRDAARQAFADFGGAQDPSRAGGRGEGRL